MQEIPLEIIYLFLQAIKNQDCNTIQSLYYQYPLILLEMGSVFSSVDHSSLKDISSQTWENFFHFRSKIISEKLLQDLRQHSNPSKNGLSTLGKFQYFDSKEAGHQAGIIVTKKSLNPINKTNQYLIKVDSNRVLIEEVLGSVLFRFFLDDSAPKNKLVLNCVDKQIYMVSKFLPDFENFSKILIKSGGGDIIFVDQFSNFYKVIAVALLLRYDDFHNENLGILSTKNQAAIVDFTGVLQFSFDGTDPHENGSDQFFENFVRECFSQRTTSLLSLYQPVYQALEETFLMAEKF
jgi:hypothetical protein